MKITEPLDWAADTEHVEYLVPPSPHWTPIRP